MTSPAGRSASAAPTPRSIWLTRRAVVAHLVVAVWVPGCAVAAWWQVGIALGGDALGWVYSVMWPCFAIFGIVFWWFLVHDDPDRLGARGLRRQAAAAAAAAAGEAAVEAGESEGDHPGVANSGPFGAPGPHGATGPPAAPEAGAEEAWRIAEAEADDPELAEYNAYLAALRDQGKTWRRRSPHA